MKMKETDQKSHAKALITLVIVLSILVILLAIIDVFQIIKVGELKASIVEKDKANAKAIAEKDIIITDLQTLNDELEADIEAMANQSQQVREELKVFQHKYDELATVDTRLINRVKKVINFCNDETFIPDLLKIVAVLEEIIRRI